MISSGRLTLGFMIVYIASLPLLWPPLFAIAGAGKVIVLADFAFAALVVILLGFSAHRLLPIQRDAVTFSLFPIAALVISSIFTGVGARAFPDILRTVYSICVFLLFAHFRLSLSETVAVARSWLVVALLISVAGFVSFLGVTLFGVPQNPLAYGAPGLGKEVVRVSSTLGINALILYLLVSVALCVFLIGSGGTSVRQRRALQYALVALLLVSLLTISRGIAGLVLSLALFGYVSRDRVPGLWRARHALACAAGLLVAGAAIATIWAIFPVEVGLDASREKFRVEVDVHKSWYYVVHTAALRMFSAYPLMGVGPGEFGSNVARFTTRDERRSAWPPIGESVDYDPHSAWFGWAAKGGIVGLVGWLVLYVWILIQLIRRRPSEDPFNMRRLSGIALVGILLSGFHVEISHLKFIWAFLGIGMGVREGREVPVISNTGSGSQER